MPGVHRSPGVNLSCSSSTGPLVCSVGHPSIFSELGTLDQFGTLVTPCHSFKRVTEIFHASYYNNFEGPPTSLALFHSWAPVPRGPVTLVPRASGPRYPGPCTLYPVPWASVPRYPAPCTQVPDTLVSCTVGPWTLEPVMSLHVEIPCTFFELRTLDHLGALALSGPGVRTVG